MQLKFTSLHLLSFAVQTAHSILPHGSSFLALRLIETIFAQATPSRPLLKRPSQQTSAAEHSKIFTHGNGPRPATKTTCTHSHSEHRFPAPSSLKEGCRKPVLGVWHTLPLHALLIYVGQPKRCSHYQITWIRQQSTFILTLSPSVCLCPSVCLPVSQCWRPRASIFTARLKNKLIIWWWWWCVVCGVWWWWWWWWCVVVVVCGGGGGVWWWCVVVVVGGGGGGGGVCGGGGGVCVCVCACVCVCVAVCVCDVERVNNDYREISDWDSWAVVEYVKIAMYASPTAMNSVFLIHTFPVYSISFFESS